MKTQPRSSGAFTKVLVANRGEIAVRVMRTLREMGIGTVAVYSDADRAALHVRTADEAVRIGPPASRESYLRIERIIDAARATGAQAIHPGYGFLSEKAAFAQACVDAGIVFIGPPPSAIDAMGEKTGARARMSKAGVPVVPGSDGPIDSAEEALVLAKRIGFPVMLKAAAGGGGKGMRRVAREEDFAAAFRGARSEAESAFGDGRVYLEKFLEKPRHIEIQVLADARGRCIHLGERECSVQRRHQKVIEESPSPLVDETMRSRMGEVAVRAAEAVGYVGAGTVEFLVDAHKNFYFLEMNTRLQVEHPVTELVTGTDLVRAQVEIAAGGALPWKQEEVRRLGHAIEARIYAEDPAKNFFPSPGKIRWLRWPAGPGIRLDAGIYPGYEVPIFYDPMIAKLCAWAPTRADAIARLRRALSELVVYGIKTNTAWLREVLKNEEFAAGDYDTGLLERAAASLRVEPNPERAEVALIAAAIGAYERDRARTAQVVSRPMAESEWRRAGRARGLRRGG